MSQDLSRRTLLRTGAAAGAAGLAAGALGVVATNAVTSTASGQAAGGAPGGGPVVLHVRDARTGEIEIFTGNSILRLRDTGITSRISQAIG